MDANPRTLATVLACALAGVFARDAMANGFALPDQDAFATARGEAFVATADNASAIFYNPAGLTQLTGNNLRGGVDGIYLNPTYRPPNGGQTFDSSKNLVFVPQFFYASTLTNLPVSVGLGVYAPFGGDMNWPENTGFRTVAISGSLQYITINPAIAVKLLPSLSVGAGAMINYGSINTHQGLEPVYGLARVTDFFNFTGDGWSVGYNAGILWQPYKTISIGATFRSSARLNFTGHTSFRDTTTSYNKPTSWDASASFNFPLTVVAGLSYRPTPKWNLEFDANYTDWSSFDNVSIKQPPTVTSTGFPVQNVPMNLDWQGSWMYELGVTRYFGKGWHVSAGYAFNQNSVPNTYYTPLAADLDRNFVSLGAGFKGRRFDFDIAYQAGFAWDHTVSGSTSSTKAITATSGETANGTYGFSSQAVFVTAGVHF